MRPELRPDARQLADLRGQLHDIADRAIEAWPAVDRAAREMTRGFAGGAGGGAASGDGDPTMRAALFDGADPAQKAEEWLAHFREFVGHAKTLDAERRHVVAIDPASIESMRGRQSLAEVCVECGRPVIKGRRVDGHLVHDESPGTDDHGESLPVCYHAIKNRKYHRRSGQTA